MSDQPHLRLVPRERDPDEYPDTSWWRSSYDRPAREKADDLAYPERIEVSTELFGCSGSLDSHRFREATKLRALHDMTWEEARLALARLHQSRGIRSSREAVELAEFALPASGFVFVGKRGDHAVNLRDKLALARAALRVFLGSRLTTAASTADELARPVTQHGPNMADENQAYTIAKTLSTKLPNSETWVPLYRATPEQILGALDSLRDTITEWGEGRAAADGIADRLALPDELPTAEDYAEAVYIADMLVWSSQSLLRLYAGMMIAMPIYRLHPTAPERQAVALWWPWGRPEPLFDGKPSPAPKPRKATLDPSIITATRPQDIVREVMEKTGINRTTAQKMTAPMRARMRKQRLNTARSLLRQGMSKAEVARTIGLSPSRISALFKGEDFDRQYQKKLDELLEASRASSKR